MFWEDSKGLMYYFDKEKRNGNDKKKIKESCPNNMHVYTTGITGSGEIPEVTEKAKAFGMELNNSIFHQLICVENYCTSTDSVENNCTFEDNEFDSKPNFSRV